MLPVSLLLLLVLVSSSLPGCQALTARTALLADPSSTILLEIPHLYAVFGPRSPDVSAPLFLLESLAVQLHQPLLPQLCSFPVGLNASVLDEMRGRIFVVMRSYESQHCSFDRKVNISQALGARAVIVANVPTLEKAGAGGEREKGGSGGSGGSSVSKATSPEYGSGLVMMKPSDDWQFDIRIPSVFIGYDSFLTLRELYEQSGGQVEVELGEELTSELGIMRKVSVFLPFAAALASIVLFWQNMAAYWEEESRREREEETRLRQAEDREQAVDSIPDPTSSAAAPLNHATVAIRDEEALGEDGTQSDDELLSNGEQQQQRDDDEMDEFFEPPTRSLSEWLEDAVVHCLSFLAKPRAILCLNALTYLSHIASSIVVLSLYSAETCSNDLQALSSLFLCRAVIGLRIAYWQTHSDTPMPSCVEVFVKNWSAARQGHAGRSCPLAFELLADSALSLSRCRCAVRCDYVFLFTGSIQVWSSDTDCAVLAPHMLLASQCFVLLIYLTFASRVLLFLYIKMTALHQSIAEQEAHEQQTSSSSSSLSSSQAHGFSPFSPGLSSPHFLTLARALLDIVNAGFYCAGPLDTARPATPLDLRSLPTVKYRAALQARGGEAACSICMQEYEEGEVLRLLYCRHFFHRGCVDVWLLRNATCPNCRASVDKEKGQRQVRERRERRERRRSRRQSRRRLLDEQHAAHYAEQADDAAPLPLPQPSHAEQPLPDAADGGTEAAERERDRASAIEIV